MKTEAFAISGPVVSYEPFQGAPDLATSTEARDEEPKNENSPNLVGEGFLLAFSVFQLICVSV